MPYEALRPPDTTTDDRTGQPFLRVPLANSDRFARISPQDHQRVLAAGYSPNWYLHLGYVTTYAKGCVSACKFDPVRRGIGVQL